MITLKSILVPHDFSETSDAALKYAVALAETFGAKLHLLHVGEKIQTDIAMEFPIGLDEAMEDAVRERLLKIMTPAEQKALRPEFTITSGAPHVEIANYAKAHGIDLIVMGTHGRGFVGHLVMGSVAEKTVRSAPCPVLTVRGYARGLVPAEDKAVAAESSSANVAVA
jgi:nucleotide-binding universal stress UspA family protein